MEYDVLVLTASTIDLIIEMKGSFPILGGTSRCVKRSYPEPGGEGNMMIVCSRMGGKVLPAGPVANDWYGKFLLSSYCEEGIDIRCLKSVDDYETPVANCIVDENGTHTFVSRLGSYQFENDEELIKPLEKCRGLYLTGYHMTDGTLPFCGLSLKLLKRASELKKDIFFDPGPVCGEIPKDILKEVLLRATVIALNQEESTILTGQKTPKQAAEILAEKTDALILVKAGAQGCYAITDKNRGKWYPGFQVPAVDTSGAGDSFFGAFIYAWQHGMDTEKCIITANAAGAVKASKPGTGTQVPTLTEIVDLLEKKGYNFLVRQ